MSPTATSRTLSRSAKLLKLSHACSVRVLAPCSRARSCCDESASRRGILEWRGESVKMDCRVGTCLFGVLARRGRRHEAREARTSRVGVDATLWLAVCRQQND
jgi:hypothetical protein